ncbi:MAG: ATP-dependent DNA ligase, partial [Acidobacteriaceae bacterium]
MTELESWATLCERLAGTTKKLEKRAWMADYLREAPVEGAALAALYLSGTPFPETDRRQLNVGGAILWRVVEELTKASDAAMHEAYRRHGDMGAAAFDLLAKKGGAESATLTIDNAAEIFSQLAGAKGTAPRQTLLRDLLGRATPLEAKYLIKLMLSDMRIGVKQAQVEEAIAVAMESDLAAVRRAVMLLGDLSEVVRLSAANRLDEARMRLFHPLGFMLASPVDSVPEAMARFAEEIRAERKGKGGAQPAPEVEEPEKEHATSEPPPANLLVEAHVQDKFDGIRCQVHCGDPSQPGRVALFSRSRDDMTHSFPELTEAFANVTEPLILDGEILAWNTDSAATQQRALPFKSLQNRIGRKRVT